MTDQTLFAAVNDEILQVDLWSGELIRKLEFKHIKPPGVNSFCINAIKAGIIMNENILVAVNDAGEVIINFVSSSRPSIVFDNHISSWGIAIQSTKNLVAVSSNAWNIRIYNMNSMESCLLEGHYHNIPGIDFSADGNFLVSCSIDGSCRIWNVDTGDLIAGDIISNQWHWTAQFIRKEDLQPVKDLSAFFSEGVRNSSEEQVSELMTRYESEESDLSDMSDLERSSESWHSAQTSADSTDYYDCLEDSQFVSKDLILSSNAKSLFLSEQYGKNIVVQAQIKEISDIRHIQFRDLNRLTLIRWIKELSAAVVASQAGLVGIVRIVKCSNPGHKEKYGMRVETWLQLPVCPILGISSIPQFDKDDPSLNRVLLTVISYDLQFHLFSLSFPSLVFSLETCDF